MDVVEKLLSAGADVNTVDQNGMTPLHWASACVYCSSGKGHRGVVEGLLSISVSIAVIHTSSGAVQGAVISFRDVAEEVEVDKMKSEFVSLAAHQLRTPMTSLRWNIETLLKGEVGKLSDLQTEILGDMEAANIRMLHLVTDLLNIARLEEGRVSIDPKPRDLGEFIKEVIKPVVQTAKRKGVKLSMVIDPSIKKKPVVSIDPMLIHQVVHNFVTNAVKYSREKDGEVKVILSKWMKQHSRL